MDRLLMVVGAVVAGCGVVVAIKNASENKNGALEWVLLIAGILVFVIGLNL